MNDEKFFVNPAGSHWLPLGPAPAKPTLRRVIVSEIIWSAGKREARDIGPAVFHQWGCEFEEFEGGPGNCTVAIVEFPDGSIKTVLPHNIKFEVPL